MITVERIMEHNPCEQYPESRVRELIGDGKTPLEILDLPIPGEDRIWVLTRRGMIPEMQQHEFACRCAESVLHIYEAQYPDDKRPRTAIETKRRWMRGEATDEELDAAWAAARAAASAAAWAAAWDAARAAAWDAEKERQIGMLRDIVSEEMI